MLNDQERRLHLHQCSTAAAAAGGGDDVGAAGLGVEASSRRRRLLPGADPPSSVVVPAASWSRSRAALKVTRKYRQAAVRRREYRKLKAIIPTLSTKHAVSKVYTHRLHASFTP